nr:hypothetical protein [Tanacetum cinerariifolium]
MHNNIMAAGSRDRLPMLAPGRYPQWCSRFLRYIDTKPNVEALRKCILSGPYKLIIVLVHVVEATVDSPAIPEHTTEMWEAIERLQQGESLNIQDVKTNLFWEFGKFTSHDGESMEAYYTRFSKLMNEMIRNNLTVTTMQVNVQFLQQLQPEWSRFVTIVKQQHKLDEVSYHKLFDILKQYQNEVNELRAEKLARNDNPLALVTTAQASQDQYYQTSSVPEQAQRDKDMQKNLALIAKYFKKIYKPTTNNLRTSSNSKNKNVDMTLWYKNDDHSRQFRTQRTVNVACTREKVGSQVVQKTGIQCFNYKEYGHFAKECKKPKRVKDSTYHKEKMLLCKQAKQVHYSYMAKIQEVPTADSGTDSKPVKQWKWMIVMSLLIHPICVRMIFRMTDVESDDERVVLANLIANSKLDVDENKKIQKQLKKANTTLAQELKECKTILAETSKSLGESISVRDSCLVTFQTKQAEFEKFKAFNDRTIDYNKLERKLNEALGQLAHKDTVIKEGLKTKAYELSVVKEKHDELMNQSLLTKSHYEGIVKQKIKLIMDLKLREEHDIEKMLSMEKQLKFLNEVVYKRSQSIQTIHMMAPKVSTYNGRPTFTNPKYLKQAQFKISCLYALSYDQSTPANKLIPDGEETLALERESRSKLNKDLVRPYDYTKLNSLYEIFKPPTQDKSRQAYNVMTNNINHFKQIVDDAWIKHSKDLFCAPTAHDKEILIQTCLMPLAIKTQSDSLKFVHELKQEMHADLKYVKTLEKEIDELKSNKAEFSDMYDVILHECVSKDVMYSYLMSLSNLDALDELKCLYLHKVKECECLAQKLSKQTESVSKKVVEVVGVCESGGERQGSGEVVGKMLAGKPVEDEQ